MPTDVAVACGGETFPAVTSDLPSVRRVTLNLGPPAANVRVRVADVHTLLRATVPSELLDLVEVAAYVYAADQSVPRGAGADHLGERWRRRFHVRVPVRRPDLWAAAPVATALADALGFMTDDEYRFEFTWQKGPATQPGYIEFGEVPFAGRVDEVALFSGGLDSLAGAIDAATNRRQRAILVNHRSHEKWTPVFDHAVAELTGRLGLHAPLCLPVHVNKVEDLTRDQNQRSRMFLYAGLGAAVARMLGLDALQVYENGVVGLNLPVLGQLVGARASRTTHPRTLGLMARFLTALLGRPFAVENPFAWHTKADVVRVIAAAGHADLIGPAISCGGTIGRSNARPHCGACSQCLDRRFGVLAAGLAGSDPASRYEIDLVTGERTRPDDRAMLVGYLDRARRIDATDPVGFLAAYGEAVRALPPGGGRASETARRVYDLYKRHSAEVLGVLAWAVAGDADRLARGTGDPSPLVALVVRPPAHVVEVPAPEPDYLFRPRDDFWLVRYEGSETRYVRDSEGLKIIHRLLGAPGEDFSNLLLTGQPASEPPPPVRLSGLPLADKQAINECRKEVKKLDRQIEQAAESDDTARVGVLQDEKKKLTDYLRSVTTIRGDSRKSPSAPERARKLVTTNISNAIKSLRRHHESLADHLAAAVLKRDGTCSYAPQEPLPWEL